MTAKHVAWVVLAVWSGWASRGLTDEVEVTVDSAQVRVQSEVIAPVKKGDRLVVIRREGPWLGVVVETPEGERRGWVLVTQVRAVVPPGIDEQSPAPAAPKLIDVAVSSTQCVFGNPPALYFELTISNKGIKGIPYDPGHLELKVDGQTLKPVFTAGSTPDPNYTPIQVFTGDGRLTQTYSQQLNRLESGELAAGGEVTGWLGFQLPTPIEPQMLGRPESKPKSWVLSWQLGGEAVQLDLTKVELDTVGAKVQPAALDPSVQVLVLGPRINVINGGKVVEALESLAGTRQPFVVMCTRKGCLIDPIAAQWIGNILARGGYQSSGSIWVNFTVEGQPYGYYGPSPIYFGPGGPMRTAKSEPTAVLEILAQRPDAEPILTKHLASPSAEIRAVAAQGLAGHRGSPDVVEALAMSAADNDTRVRTAAIHSLGGISQTGSAGMPPWVVSGGPGQPSGASSPGPAKLEGSALEVVLKATGDPAAEVRAAAVTVLASADDPRATEAVVKALRETHPLVRSSAARSAASHPVDVVAPLLIDVLDEQDLGITMVACESLGRLKAQAAVPRLRQLQASKKEPLAVWAVDALRAIGTLSELEAALAKLDVGQLNPNEFDVLAKAKDRRCVPQLMEFLQGGRSFDQVGRAARLLAELGEKSAVEPLINILTYAEQFADDLPRALGQLGDERAIEPLKKVLARQANMDSRRIAILEALWMFEVPEATEQVTKQIEQNRNNYETVQLVQVLGRSGKNRAISILEPLLDDQNLCQPAAQALAEIGTPEALATIRKRLFAPDYKLAMNVISSLVDRPTLPAFLGSQEAQQQQARQTAELLRDLAKSTNADTRSVAMQRLQSLEERLSADELQEFERLVADRQLDAADKALQAILDRQVELVEQDPAQVTRLNAHVNRMLNAYMRNQESKRADGHLVKILAALEAMVKKSDDEVLRQTLSELRTRRIISLLDATAEVDPNDFQKTLAELGARIKAKTAANVRAPEMDTAMRLADALERHAQWELAADAYRILADAIPSVADGQFAGMKEMFEGTARRLGLMGKPVEVQGTCMDDTSFDWATYRGKVVLVDFWAADLPEHRAELPNTMQRYERYRARGFEVVGISLDSDRALLEKFLESEKIPWVTLHERKRARQQSLARDFGITSIPTAFLVDKEGKVVSLRAGGQELDRLLQEQIGPPYQPTGRLMCLDLGAKATRKRSEMFTGFADNNLMDLPGGEQTLGGVKFSIGDSVVQLAGQRLTDAPARVEGIVVDTNVAKLYFLQATQFGGETPRGVPGAKIGEYRACYEDGSAESIPIVVGEDVRDWWNGDAGSATSRGIVVWTGTSAGARSANVRLRLYLGIWANPHPDKKVATIDFVSANTPAAPFCVAITAEETPASP